MKMNKDKPHWRVTFNCNMDAGNNYTVDVWAPTIKKAEKAATEIMRRKEGIWLCIRTSVELCEE